MAKTLHTAAASRKDAINNGVRHSQPRHDPTTTAVSGLCLRKQSEESGNNVPRGYQAPPAATLLRQSLELIDDVDWGLDFGQRSPQFVMGFVRNAIEQALSPVAGQEGLG